MKIKTILSISAIFVFSVVLSTCDAFGTVIGTVRPKQIQTYFQSNGGARSARNTQSSTGSRIEFFVASLLFGHDSGSGSTWIIGFPPSVHNNGGWYDIDGINRAHVYHHGTPERSSLIRFSIKGVRIDNVVYNFDPWTGAASIFTGTFSYDNHSEPLFDIIAGDITKPGNQFINPNAPVIPMASIANMHEVSEFILVVDEEKLHTDGVPNSNWWECFSFVVRLR